MIRQLLCRMGLFEGVYVEHCDKSNYQFRLVRFDKRGERYVRYVSHDIHLLPDGRAKGHWNYLTWKLKDPNKKIKRSWIPFRRPRNVEPMGYFAEELKCD